MSQESVIRSTALCVEVGAELLDSSGTFILDFSDDFLSGEIMYDNETSKHATAKFKIARSFNWENQRIAPYITLTDDVTGESYRFNLGVYLLETPKRMVGTIPVIYEVSAYGLATLLDTPYGSTYAVASGASYITTIESLLTDVGLDYNIDQASVAETLTTGIVWTLDSENTYLKIINDLLAGIGYEQIYADRDGTMKSIPWLTDAGLTPIFAYNADADDTIITISGLESEADYWDIPNKWIFVLDNPDETLPVEGAGIYTVTNQADGASSINSRGRTLIKIVKIKEAANQDSLVVQGNKIVQKDRRITQTIKLQTVVNPLHWHRNVVTLNSADLGLNTVKFTETSWRLPLNRSGRMTHSFKEIA